MVETPWPVANRQSCSRRGLNQRGHSSKDSPMRPSRLEILREIDTDSVAGIDFRHGRVATFQIVRDTSEESGPRGSWDSENPCPEDL